MGYHPIVNKDQRQMEGLRSHELPQTYMEDFSVLGFRVDDCERALEILDQASFGLMQSQNGVQVEIESASRMKDVVELLQANGLACEVADIAQGMYQG